MTRTSTRRCHRAKAAALSAAAFGVFLLVGCSAPSPPDSQELAAGVTLRQDRLAQVQTLTLDRHSARVRPVIVAENVQRIRNNFVGDAYTVRDWAEKYSAIGGINGGFFGETYDQAGHRKQLVQLAVVNGVIVAPGSAIRSTSKPGERYLRSAIGFTAQGVPQITWASGNRTIGLFRHERAVNATAKRPWKVGSAVSCGPRLIHSGKVTVLDYEERLVSPEPRERIFVAYDPLQRYLVLGRASEMRYADVARYLTIFFERHLHTRVQEAMCLDGGASAQLVYQKDGTLQEDQPTGVQVPSALLLVPQ